MDPETVAVLEGIFDPTWFVLTDNRDIAPVRIAKVLSIKGALSVSISPEDNRHDAALTGKVLAVADVYPTPEAVKGALETLHEDEIALADARITELGGGAKG